jgi:hypothetical protein
MKAPRKGMESMSRNRPVQKRRFQFENGRGAQIGKKFQAKRSINMDQERFAKMAA